MNNSIKLILASLVLAGTVTYAVHEGKMDFQVTNNFGKKLHIHKLNPETGDLLNGPIIVEPGRFTYMEKIPPLIYVHYPEIEKSGRGLFFKPEKLQELAKEGKCVYLVVEPTRWRNKVSFTPLEEKENNICKSSLKEAKSAYSVKDKEINIEEKIKATMVTPAAVEVMEEVETGMEEVETGTVYCPKCDTMHSPSKKHAALKCPCQRPRPLTIAGCSCQKPKPLALEKCPCQRPKPLTIARCSCQKPKPLALAKCSCQRPKPLV